MGRQCLAAHPARTHRPARHHRTTGSRNPRSPRRDRRGSGRAREGSEAASALDWAARYHVTDIGIAAEIEHWDLGLGEAQVIAHCLAGSRWAVLDDRAARRCAAAHRVPVIGTLGVVVRAKQHRQIESARLLVKELIAAGMFLDDETLERVLKSIGE